METPEDYIGKVIDIYSENVAAIVHPDGTEELAHGKYTIDGKYKVIDYDEGNNEFALLSLIFLRSCSKNLITSGPPLYFIILRIIGLHIS